MFSFHFFFTNKKLMYFYASLIKLHYYHVYTFEHIYIQLSKMKKTASISTVYGNLSCTVLKMGFDAETLTSGFAHSDILVRHCSTVRL